MRLFKVTRNGYDWFVEATGFGEAVVSWKQYRKALCEMEGEEYRDWEPDMITVVSHSAVIRDGVMVLR